MTERKMAVIKSIDEVKSIPDADKICAYKVGGWWVVDQVGKYVVGDYVIYAEIDSWIPTTIAPFLSKGKEPHEFEGVKGERLRTVRLKKQLSQGLLLPMSVMTDNGHTAYFTEGLDVSECLGIVKYEAPIPANLAGMTRGLFPSCCPKTDQERCCEATTQISTEHGIKTIKEICDEKYAGKVRSFNHDTNNEEWKSVIGWSVKSRITHPWLKIKTKSGKEIIVTSNHKVFVENDICYREAKYLKVGDLLKTCK